jgi:hypothetical protein
MADGGEGLPVPPDASPWGPVIAWLREDKTIAEWLTDAEAQVLINQRLDDLPVWKALTLYQGFDMKRTVRNMFSSYRTYIRDKERQEVAVQLKVGSELRDFRYNNHETIASDVELLIFLFANRKYTAKSHPELKTITDWLIEKYGINVTVNLPLAALDPDVVTIPRIVACFPGKVCEFFNKGFGNNLSTFNDIGIMIPGTLSKSILCPHFTALIPQDIVRNSTSIHYVSFLVHVVVDDVIHKKEGNYTNLENIFTYYRAKYNSNVTPQSGRVAFCRRMGMLTPDETLFVPLIEGQSAWCIDRLRVLRPNDPRINEVISDLNRLV